MKASGLHSWQVSIPEARDIQMRLASQVSRINELGAPELIAGVDISVNKSEGTGEAAVVILSYPELSLLETRYVKDKLNFPYIPGLLSFRESPLIMAACEKLTLAPDLILVDGQGLAHPRRFGLASHLGLLLDIPTIGCAKSRLCGSHEEPGAEPGSYAELTDDGEVIGAALRTRMGVNPVYVSIGHKVDLQTAIYWTMACCRDYRLPEPTRFAHMAAGGNLPQQTQVPQT